MSIFLNLNERYEGALRTFDPLRGEWFMKIIDPQSIEKPDGNIRYLRLLLVGLFLFLPPLIFSAIPSSSYGGQLLGRGGLIADIGIYGIIFFMGSSLIVLPITRRVLGDLINELVLRKISPVELRKFSPESAPKGKLLIFLEWLSRVDGRRGLIWCSLLIVNQIYDYYVFLTDGKPTWHTSPADPGSFFYFLRIGNEQPNCAGLWAFFVFSPLGIYFVVLLARLIVIFACQCSAISKMEKLLIIPSHPDGTGGLLPIGQVALMFAVFTFILGIDMAAMVSNELVVNETFRPLATNAKTNLELLYVLFALYLILGTILFFLPLYPLRGRMAKAKRTYLLELTNLQTAAEQKHKTEISNKWIKSDTIQELTSINAIIKSVTDMAVWPFDKKTFFRYGSLLVTPILPLLGNQLPSIIARVRHYLGI